MAPPLSSLPIPSLNRILCILALKSDTGGIKFTKFGGLPTIWGGGCAPLGPSVDRQCVYTVDSATNALPYQPLLHAKEMLSNLVAASTMAAASQQTKLATRGHIPCKKVKAAPILDCRAQGSGADPGSWQIACR